MYSNLKGFLGLSQTAGPQALSKACNEYYWMYTRIASVSHDLQIKSLAIKKIQALRSLMEAENVRLSKDELFASAKDAKTVTYVEDVLSNPKNTDISWQSRQFLTNEIEKTVADSKKEYLLAEVAYTTSPLTKEVLQEISEHIKRAAAMDPENPVYGMIQEDIIAEVESYDRAYQAWHTAEEERLAKEHRKKVTKSVLGGIGSGILAVLGFIGTALLGILGCFCECIDC